MSDVTDTPTAPPKPPVIPVGLGTQVGLAATAVQWLVALVTALLAGDHSEETITALITGGVTLATVIAGRMIQAAAAYLADRAGVDYDPEDDDPWGDAVLDEGDEEAWEAEDSSLLNHAAGNPGEG